MQLIQSETLNPVQLASKVWNNAHVQITCSVSYQECISRQKHLKHMKECTLTTNGNASYALRNASHNGCYKYEQNHFQINFCGVCGQGFTYKN